MLAVTSQEPLCIVVSQSLHSSAPQPSRRLCHAHAFISLVYCGVLCVQLLANRLRLAEPEAAYACQRLHTQAVSSDAGLYSIAVSSAISYQLPEPWLHGYTDPGFTGALSSGDAWDAGAPWYPWAEQPNPVHALHLDLVWAPVPVQVWCYLNLLPKSHAAGLQMVYLNCLITSG
jgi:hypothetical protein